MAKGIRDCGYGYGYGCATGTDTGVRVGVDVNSFMGCTVYTKPHTDVCICMSHIDIFTGMVHVNTCTVQ